jgi:hypothetical protein
MSKIFSTDKKKHIDIINIDDNVVLFIQDDNSYPSKINSIQLKPHQVKNLIKKLQEKI